MTKSLARTPIISLGAILLALPFMCVLRGEAQGALFIGSNRTEDSIRDDLEHRWPMWARQVGSTSVTLRVDLGAEVDAAFKPRTRAHQRGFLAEIAAYRLAKALGMDNVPPVVGRSFPRAALADRFQARDPADWDPIEDEIIWDGGVARGAMIYWLPRMRSTELSSLSGLEAATPWLAQDGVRSETSLLARDLSTMLAFDYLIGNWDRFSGGNVSTDQSGQRLYVRDHNVAFIVPLSRERYSRIRTNLERVQRFSRSFVEHLMALDDAALRQALAEDRMNEVRPILGDDQIAAVLRRRRALLSYVGALIAVYGADRVLTWP